METVLCQVHSRSSDYLSKTVMAEIESCNRARAGSYEVFSNLEDEADIMDTEMFSQLVSIKTRGGDLSTIASSEDLAGNEDHDEASLLEHLDALNSRPDSEDALDNNDDNDEALHEDDRHDDNNEDAAEDNDDCFGSREASVEDNLVPELEDMIELMTDRDAQPVERSTVIKFSIMENVLPPSSFRGRSDSDLIKRGILKQRCNSTASLGSGGRRVSFCESNEVFTPTAYQIEIEEAAAIAAAEEAANVTPEAGDLFGDTAIPVLHDNDEAAAAMMFGDDF